MSLSSRCCGRELGLLVLLELVWCYLQEIENPRMQQPCPSARRKTLWGGEAARGALHLLHNAERVRMERRLREEWASPTPATRGLLYLFSYCQVMKYLEFYLFQCISEVFDLLLPLFLSNIFSLFYLFYIHINMGFPGGASGKEPTCQCRRHKRHMFFLWVRKIPWRRSWQPTPVFLLGKSHGQRNLVGYSPWGWKESDTIKAT